ncbi:copper resistance CopC family protein [Herbiconiux daphne]|uniref:Copper resistance protein CopC n=1 Tax=Herbiconiux daphne TaxID=2970914 RepID=A0ABT2H685_9MICO|nr:copper resistance protein CopC [Herbiconiux daphne]MCS5735457.1 copper resistance protein CopC [Herbiconiux daphne]
MIGATGLAAAGLVGGATIGAVSGASAHDFLVSTSPAADSTVTDTLTEVSLTFNEPPLDDAGAAIAVEVHDPSGANIAVGSVSIVNSTLTTSVAPVSTGPHTVLWQTVSGDGHAVSGQFVFDYEGAVPGAAGGSGATTPTGSPGSGEGAPSSTPAATEGPATPTTPSAAASASGVPPTAESTTSAPASTGGGVQLPFLLIGVGSAAAVIVVVGVVTAVVLGRRRRSTPAAAAAGDPTNPPPAAGPGAADAGRPPRA